MAGEPTRTRRAARHGGRGGAGDGKWRTIAVADNDVQYIVSNGDESEPGTFKDRELLLRTPHLVVEGVILAGLITGATRGYIYIRHEYHEQIKAIEAAIEAAVRQKACAARTSSAPALAPRRGLRQPRRLHLRRAERAARGDGGSPRPSREPGRRNCPRTACSTSRPRQQRRDAGLGPGHLLSRARTGTPTPGTKSRPTAGRARRAGGCSRSAAT